MYIITNEDNMIIGIGGQLGYTSNGYPEIIDCDTVFPFGIVKELETIPESVEAFKYCYDTEQGFYLNPDWKEPEQLYTLDEAAEIIAKEASTNGYDA